MNSARDNRSQARQFKIKQLLSRWRQRLLRLPRWGRIITGVLLIFGGVLGFLPILGFWMLPLGVVVLSYDIGWIRRLRRRVIIRTGRRWRRRKVKSE